VRNWKDEPPQDGTFAYVRHDRMNPTMAFRLGDRLYYFGENPVDHDGRTVEGMPESTQYSPIKPPRFDGSTF